MFAAPAADLSVYRLLLDQVYHVAVLGQPPPRPLARRIERALARGEFVNLPSEVLAFLAQRRAQAQQLAPWVEGHYDVEAPPARPDEPML